MTTPNTKTRRIFHFAQVLEGEPHEPNGEGYKCWREPKTGNSYAYSAGAGILHPEWMPVNQLPETTEPVTPASTKIPFPENGMPPRTERIRIVFEDEIRSTQAFPDANGKNWYLKTDGTIVFVEACDEIPWNSIPLRREETRTPAPTPKTRKRVVFEECDEADWKGDAMGRWWYQPKGTVKIVYSTYELSAEKGIVYFNRTEETVEPTKPPVWDGDASTNGPDGDCGYYSRVGINNSESEFIGKTFDSLFAAVIDLDRLKALAETYAAMHGATIEWEEAK